MRMIKFSMMLLLFIVFLTGCSSKEKYLTKVEALAQGSIVLNGTISENRNRFDIFIKNVDAGRDDSIQIYNETIWMAKRVYGRCEYDANIVPLRYL